MHLTIRGGNLKVRKAGLDIIRCLAIFCVIGGHYFLNTNFNDTPFDTPLMFTLGMIQTYTSIGVPLFLMLTGYLNLWKLTPDRKYYKGIWRVLIAYLIFSIITILFRKYYLGQEKSSFEWLHSIFKFEGIPYGWYIEMWIGLFLLTPFLNKLWHSISEKSNRRILIIILFACSAIPDFTNRYGLHILPDYWSEAAYPLLCFYLGSYLRTYQPSIKPIYLIGAITLLCLFNPLVSMIVANGKPMLHLHGSAKGIFSIPIAVASFLLFYKNDVSIAPVRSLITKISLLSLDMYLTAYLFDQWFYPIWKDLVGSRQSEIGPYYFLIILSLMAGTFIVSYLYNLFIKIIKRFFAKINLSNEAEQISPDGGILR